MKKISKIQASKRILKIAKNVAIVQASNNKLTPLEIAKVQKTVGLILASADLDESVLSSIESLDNTSEEEVKEGASSELLSNGTSNPNKLVQELQKNKSEITKEKNKQMKGNSGVKNFLSENGIKLTKPMKVGKFFEIIKELLLNYESISNPYDTIEEE